MRTVTRMVGSFLIPVLFLSAQPSFAQEDLREYQHGIDFIPRNDTSYWLIWSSSGNPPQGAGTDGSWTHDIFYSDIDPHNPKISPIKIISNPEAQEPASSAISDDGHIMITMEDGWNAKNVVAQRYGLYDQSMNPVKPYPNTALDGGHSGHVAASGNRFVIFYSEGWVDDGGVDNLGSGDDVMLKVYDSTGNYERESNISVGSAYRDWWPMIAGSHNCVMLLWQRFVNGQEYADLMYSVYNPATGQTVKGNTRLTKQVKYYTYDVQYIPSIDRFLVAGAYASGGGYSFLINNNGDVTAINKNLPALIREAQPAVKQSGSAAFVVYPKQPNGLYVLSLSDSSITLNNEISDSYSWRYMGTDGIFTDTNSVYFVSLSKTGCVEKRFHNVISTSKLNNGKASLYKTFILYQNYPNPFNPTTAIRYELANDSDIELSVHDISGRSIATLASGVHPAGSHIVYFDGSGLPSGMYCCTMTNNIVFQTTKLLLVK